MKRLIQEDDLTLLKIIEYNNIPSYKEIIFFVFMIVLYNSGYARWLFWTLIGIFVFLSINYLVEARNDKTMRAIVRKELERSRIIKR